MTWEYVGINRNFYSFSKLSQELALNMKEISELILKYDLNIILKYCIIMMLYVLKLIRLLNLEIKFFF